MRLPSKSVAYLLAGSCAVIGLGQERGDSATTEAAFVLTLGHSSNLTALAVSPDGLHLATASHDKTARLWETHSGAELRVLQHTAPVTAASFLSNTQFVTGTSDGDLLVWDIQTGQPTMRAKVGSWIDRLLTSPDGKELWCKTLTDGVFAVSSSTLAAFVRYETESGVAVSRTARDDGTYGVVRWSGNRAFVEWWHGSALSAGGSLHQVEKRITSGALASDGLTLLLGTEDGIVHRLRGKGLTEGVSYPGHSGAVTALDIAPDGSKFASAGQTDNVVLVRSVETGSQIRKIDSPQGAFDQTLFASNSEDVFIATDKDHSARLIGLSSGKDLSFRGHAVPVFKVQSSRDHRYLFTGAWYGAHLWDSSTGAARQFPVSGSGSAAVVAPDGKRVFTGESLPHDYSQYLIAKDVRTGKEVGRFPHQTAVTAAAYSPDRLWLATGELTGKIHLWSTETGREVRTMSGHSSNISELVFGPDNTLLSQGGDHTARVWNVESGEELWREDASEYDAETFSPGGHLLAAWSGRLRLLDVKTHKELTVIEGALANFAFPNDSTLLYVNERRSTLESWSSTRSETREVQKVRDPQVVKIVPLTDTLALVCEGGTATVVDWRSGDVRHVFQNAACSLAGAPFVLVDSGGRNEVWNAVTMKQRARLPKGRRFDEGSFAASADGRFLTTTNHHFFVEDWDLNSGRLISKDEDSYRRFDSLRSGLPALAANRDRYFVSFQSNEPPQSAINRWTIEAGSKPHRLFVQPYAIDSLDVSPNGKQLVTCGGDASLRLINAETGRVIAFKNNACLDAKFSPNGALITTTALNYNGPAQVWTADLSRRLPGLDYRPSDIKHVALSDGGTTMLTLESNGDLRLWDVTKGEEKHVLPAVEGDASIQSVELMLGGTLAIAALSTGEIRSWRTSTGNPGPKYSGHHGRIWLVQRAQNNDQVFLSAGDDGSVRVWNAITSTSVRVVEQSPGSTASATLSADGGLLLVGSLDGSVRVWEVASGHLLRTFKVPSVPRAASFSSGKHSFLVGCEDGFARLINIETGQTEREFRPSRPEAISSVAYLGEFIVTSTRSGTILWGSTGKPLTAFTDGSPVMESRLFVDSARNVTFLNAGKGVHLAHLGPLGFSSDTLFREQVSSVAASPDGHRIAVGFSTGWLRVWDISSQAMVMRIRVNETGVNRLKYSSAGTAVLLAGEGKPEEWDLGKATLLRAYPASFDVTDLAFAGATDQFAVSSSSDGRVRVFDRASGKELCALIAGRNGEWLVARPDGLFDGTDTNERAVTAAARGSDRDGNPTSRSPARYRPGLLANILDGKIPPPLSAVAQMPVFPPSKTIRFDSIAPPSKALPMTEARSPDAPPPEGLGLKLLLELFANILGMKDHLKVNDGLRVETLPDGQIEVGTRALEQVFKGQSFATSLGLTAFIIAHESWHSRQAGKYHFSNLSAEDHRLLECQADVLGAIDAIKLVTAFGNSRETVGAYAGVRLAQTTVAAMNTLEGGDSSHPNQAQRQWAVEFGNARFAGRVLKDELSLVMLDRRFDARLPDDDEPWARNVCKRLLNYRLANQGDVSVSLRNERRIGDRWEGEVVYRNLSHRSLKISAHTRLVGTAFSVLTGTPSPTLANIDGRLTSFTLGRGPNGRSLLPSLWRNSLENAFRHRASFTATTSKITGCRWRSRMPTRNCLPLTALRMHHSRRRGNHQPARSQAGPKRFRIGNAIWERFCSRQPIMHLMVLKAIGVEMRSRCHFQGRTVRKDIPLTFVCPEFVALMSLWTSRVRRA